MVCFCVLWLHLSSCGGGERLCWSFAPETENMGNNGSKKERGKRKTSSGSNNDQSSHSKNGMQIVSVVQEEPLQKRSSAGGKTCENSAEAMKIDDRVRIAADRFVANCCAVHESHEASHNVENAATSTKDPLFTRPAEIKPGSVSHQQEENLPERVENLRLNVDEVKFDDSTSLQREEASSKIAQSEERPKHTGEGDADLKNMSSGGIAGEMFALELKVTNSGEPAESKGETSTWSPKSLDEMNRNRHRFRGHGGYQITNQAKSSPSKYNSSATTQRESSPIMHMVEKNEEEKKLVPVNPKFASQDVRLDPELPERPFTSTGGGDHLCSEQPRRRNHPRQHVKSTNNDKDESNQVAGGEAKKSKTFIPTRSIVCYVCGEEGHRKVDCPHRKTKSNGVNQQE